MAALRMEIDIEVEVEDRIAVLEVK